jgi:hypothetical protein
MEMVKIHANARNLKKFRVLANNHNESGCRVSRAIERRGIPVAERRIIVDERGEFFGRFEAATPGAIQCRGLEKRKRPSMGISCRKGGRRLLVHRNDQRDFQLAPVMTAIFMSCRRRGSEGFAGRLADDVTDLFREERVFATSTSGQSMTSPR